MLCDICEADGIVPLVGGKNLCKPHLYQWWAWARLNLPPALTEYSRLVSGAKREKALVDYIGDQRLKHKELHKTPQTKLQEAR